MNISLNGLHVYQLIEESLVPAPGLKRKRYVYKIRIQPGTSFSNYPS